MFKKTLFGLSLVNLLFIMLFLFGKQAAFAQRDSLYIGKFKDEFSARIFLSNAYTSLIQEVSLNDGSYFFEYLPNVPISLGIGISWKGAGFDFSQGLSNYKNPDGGVTKWTDLQTHYYGDKIVIDFFGQNYRGFYVSNIDHNNIYPDIRLTKLDLFMQYVFNANKFSYRAAFDQGEKQLKSAGTFVLGGGFYYNQIHSNNDLLQFNKTVYQLGSSLGYAYTMVVRKRFFITGSLTTGVNIGTENFHDKLTYSPTSIFRFAAGYNGDTWSLGINYIRNRITVSSIPQERITLNSSTFQLVLIKRFNSNLKLLKKLSNVTG